MADILAFVNGYICYGGKLSEDTLYVDLESGLIVDESREKVDKIYDLRGKIVAPAFIELQTNGCAGFHFTNFTDSRSYQHNLERVSKHLVTTGVGSFLATIPTVEPQVFKRILPHLQPRTFNNGAELLGAHCEGPFLAPTRKGAHDATLLQSPGTDPVQHVYGEANLKTSIKMITVAPELEGSLGLIRSLKDRGTVVSIGHSAADFDTGARALAEGAKSLTHVFNAMNPLNHRVPGIVGLIAGPQNPYYSIIADGIHLHPSVVSMAFRASPGKCILITDSLEMAGMPDGLYPGQAQIPHRQRKLGNRVTIDGTDTLIGSCISIDECVRNLQSYSGCSLAEAVRCATENVANLLGIEDRGMIDIGRRADLVILDPSGRVQSVWMQGRKTFERGSDNGVPLSDDKAPST